MRRICCLLPLFILLSTSVLPAQSTIEAEELIFKAISRELFRMPEFTTNCHSFFVTVVVRVSEKGIIDKEIAVSDGCPAELCEALKKCMLYVGGAALRKASGATESKEACKILIPFIFYSDKACAEQFTAEHYWQMMKQGLHFSCSGPVYMVPAFFIESGI